MKKAEFEKYRKHILDYMDGDTHKLAKTIEIYKDLRESHGTLWGAVDTMCQYGLFDVYYNDCLETLKWVYGDEFDESKYITKEGEWRWKNNECYVWAIYKAKIAKAIEMMGKNGEL